MKKRIHWEEIRKLAIAHQLEEPSSSVDALLRFLRLWWCRTYNRPFKDPLLMSYTIDELCYEYLRLFFLKEENDPKKKMEQETAKADDDKWIQQMLSVTSKSLESSNIDQTTENKEENKQPDNLPNLQAVDLPEISAKFDPVD